jgi:hypothetical protein
MYLSYMSRWEAPRKQVLLHATKQYACSSASGRESSRPSVDTNEVSFRQRHFIPCIAILLRRRVHRYRFNSYTIWILHPGSSCGFWTSNHLSISGLAQQLHFPQAVSLHHLDF